MNHQWVKSFCAILLYGELLHKSSRPRFSFWIIIFISLWLKFTCKPLKRLKSSGAYPPHVSSRNWLPPPFPFSRLMAKALFTITIGAIIAACTCAKLRQDANRARYCCGWHCFLGVCTSTVDSERCWPQIARQDK